MIFTISAALPTPTLASTSGGEELVECHSKGVLDAGYNVRIVELSPENKTQYYVRIHSISWTGDTPIFKGTLSATANLIQDSKLCAIIMDGIVNGKRTALQLVSESDDSILVLNGKSPSKMFATLNCLASQKFQERYAKACN